MEKCSICLSNLNVNVKTFMCGHKFHANCIAKWESINKTCPYCRKALILKSEEHKHPSGCNWITKMIFTRRKSEFTFYRI